MKEGEEEIPSEIPVSYFLLTTPSQSQRLLLLIRNSTKISSSSRKNIFNKHSQQNKVLWVPNTDPIPKVDLLLLQDDHQCPELTAGQSLI